jgi:NAD(P)-dependent dehydrogenase (short-subunit alcohol dehydrogenase family)
MPGRLDGKVAIVTGGGGGFGKGIAKKFLDEGAKVIIADFAEDVGQKTADELKCEFVRCDVTKRADWENVMKVADEKFGKIDCVINNAGTTYRNKVRDSSSDSTHSISGGLLTAKTSPRTRLPTKILTRLLPSTSSLFTTQRIPSYLTSKRKATEAHLLPLHLLLASVHDLV